ncbi:hypothetical protein BN7_117 [Wickerhamomyces ciferrii]|uniref:PX domain-containing protein n=1 Tax=Wickerhamomyces ciferrii (strain ATCC 14091 / BCRC 22168 / CBS 111 / JCM 3599 / NBRC 0793 / NRRL Y-1031 F-60-10) TaxID=1206466 RepID=K0KGN3_WICCF|nr:uncharacterized protein BN7_117 [Wickerhamomyces ciferrii]CCH40584.1 hypothetical protein BN7_117 [Wickerhamomyces ciferrii]
MDLTPTREHYLKRELLRLQLEKEFVQFNDALALRKFGSPFTQLDPNEYVVKKGDGDDGAAAGDVDAAGTAAASDFPLSRYFFNKFVLTMPFLSSKNQNQQLFWIKKVQVFYEHFMSLQLSESMDRDEETKRRKISLKLKRIILMFYNSGIGTPNESLYYQQDKFEMGQQENLSKNNKLEKLIFPSKETLQNHISNDVFINGINVNVAGVRLIKKSNKNFWSNLNITKNHEWVFEFIIKSKLELDESSTIIVARRYNDFKNLHHNLKKKYPGKILPNLPKKVKSEVEIGDVQEDDDEEEEEDEDDINSKKNDDEIRKSLTNLFKDLNINPSQDIESIDTSKPPKSPKSPKTPKFLPSKSLFKSPNKEKSNNTEPNSSPQNNKLPREKTRVSLRAYLRELLKDDEISHCDLIKEFLFKNQIFKLSKDEEIDLKIRENLDFLLLLNQIKFQSETFKKISLLKNQTLPLRLKLLEDENGLLDIFNEIKIKSHIYQLSPMLINFIDWCKINIAATIYQLFLGNDSSYEFYSQVKRFHKMLPYSIMINILKFTNPMMIMKTMLDLLMASPFGGKSLLQTLFFGILNDDLKNQQKIIDELELKLINYPNLIKRLKFFIYDVEDSNLLEEIKLESKQLNTDLLLTIIITPKLNDLIPIDDDSIGQVFESYKEYKKLKQTNKDDVLINHEKSELYSNLKSVFKLYIKNNDKNILKQIWSEPELTSILKDLLSMFYQPLINLFKNSHIEIAFKNFENFMNELILKIDQLNNDIYSMDTNKIVDEIMQVLNNHQDAFYQFLHNVYLNDSDGFFEQIINWLNDIINFLRNSKNLNTSTSDEKLNIEELLNNSQNKSEILMELDSIINSIKLQRSIYSKKLETKTQKQNDLIEKNWEKINNIEIFNTNDFGLNHDDILELDESDDEENSDEETEGTSAEDKKKFIPREEMKTEFIETLLPFFEKQLINIFKNDKNV